MTSISPPQAKAAAWFNFGIGVILILMTTRFLQYVGSQLNGSAFTWKFTDTDGSPLTYPQTVYFWGDLAIVLFGMILVFDGTATLSGRNRSVLTIAWLLTGLATLLNLGYVVYMYNGYGLQLLSAVAVVFGSYIFMMQLKEWKSLTPAR